MGSWQAFRRPSKPGTVLSTGGKWYLALTLGFGIACILSGNNILYLVESLLLGAVVISGILCEQNIKRISLKRSEQQAWARRPCVDQWEVCNDSRFPAFQISLGEWREGKWFSLVEIPFLAPKERRIISGIRIFPQRGTYSWECLAAATNFPFGFGEKYKFFSSIGKRLVWPEITNQAKQLSRTDLIRSQQGEWQLGELEAFQTMGDAQKIHWPTWARTRELFVLPQEAEKNPLVEVSSSLTNLEVEISKAALTLWESRARISLVLEERGKRRRISGRKQGLDALATFQEPAA